MDQMGGNIPQAVGLGGLSSLLGSTDIPEISKITEMVQEELMETPEEAAKERAEAVKNWIKTVKTSKTHWEPRFKKMADDMKFVRGKQWDTQTSDDPKLEDTRYVANITQRHVNQRVAALYAKNPTVVAKRRKTLDFKLWDESVDTIHSSMATMQAAQQAMAGGADPSMASPEIIASVQKASAMLAEVQEAKSRRTMLDKMGRTLEIMFGHYMNEAEPNFKIQAKQLIRRVETCGVGYVKLGFNRLMKMRPDVSAKIGDINQRLSYLKRLASDVLAAGGNAGAETVEMEELEAAVEGLLNAPKMIAKEGLVFDFPRSTAIIPDKRCINLRGFIGADFVAQEFLFTLDEVKENYGIDLDGKVTAYYDQDKSGAVVATNNGGNNNDKTSNGKVMCWEIYHKPSGNMMTVADGYDDYLTEPAPPPVWLERFWPIYTLTFNDIEDTDDIYPDSDVRLLRGMQVEHNRSREGLREHRIANRPAYVGPKGILEEADKTKLAAHAVSEYIELNIPVGTDVKTVIQPMAKVAIDPAVYDTSPFFDDMQKVVGSQEADFGGVSGVAATEVSVAEGARINTLQSNIDDLDDFLSELARGASQIMLREVSPETATKIAGPGAVWPQLSNQELSEELYLEIEAGSSGRPNRAHELANWERIAPTLLQVPGINPAWVAKKIVRVIDDSVDISDAIIDGLPSMNSMNAMAGTQAAPHMGGAENDPRNQGGQGADKRPDPQQTQGGPQPSYRQPADNQQ